MEGNRHTQTGGSLGGGGGAREESAPGKHHGLEDDDAPQDAYEGIDVDQARRLAALFCVVGPVTSVFALAVWPPMAIGGAVGWLAATALVAATLALGAWAYRQRDFNRLLLVPYAGLLVIAAGVWLTGGHGSPYAELYVLSVVYVAGIYSRQRIAAFFAVLALALAAPLVYDGWDMHAAQVMSVSLVFLLGLALLVMMLARSLRRQRISLQRLAGCDELTGLGNRRALEETLDREINRAGRTGSPLTIAIVDIDGFKGVNDQFGHLAGDQCLRGVASALAGETRRSDLCFRWGGDEFVMLLPDTPKSGGEVLQGRLGAAIERSAVVPDGRQLTVTCGFAQFSEGVNVDALIGAADDDLRKAKQVAAARAR